MEKSLLKLDKGATCTSWSYSGDRLASGSVDGTLAVFDSRHPASSSFACTSRTKVSPHFPLFAFLYPVIAFGWREVSIRERGGSEVNLGFAW